MFAVPLVLAGGADAADTSPCPPRALDGSRLTADLAAGRPVVHRRVSVRGDVRLPSMLDAPLVLRNSCLLGDLVGAQGSVEHVIDLSHTTINGRVELDGARFDAPVAFEQTEVARRSSFVLAVFDEAAHFDGAEFDRRADFSGAEFHGSASFLTTAWHGLADFSGAHFERRTSFAGASFAGAGAAGRSLDFSRVALDDDATFFLAVVDHGADFQGTTSSGDLSFQDATVGADGVPPGENAASFSGVRLLGPVSFAGATIHGRLSFDEAEASELDLAGAELDGPVRLPVGPGDRGRLGALRLDLADADRVVGPRGGDDRRVREAALALVEETARAADDLRTANDARVRRLTIARGRKGEVGRGLDMSFNYGVWGYGVRPFHQLIAIAAVLAFGAGARWAKRRTGPSSLGGRLRGAVADLGESLASLLRLHPPAGGWQVVEYLVFKALIVVFVLNAANVWPVSRDLIQGIF